MDKGLGDGSVDKVLARKHKDQSWDFLNPQKSLAV